MKQEICKAFCDTVAVRNVPAGLAVSTSFASFNGDPLGFFVVGPDSNGLFHLEEPGLLVPYLASVGADLDNATRREAFEQLLEEHDALFEEEDLEIISTKVPEKHVPNMSLRFINLLIRLRELEWMAQDKVASTFKNDASTRLQEALGERARLLTREDLSDHEMDWEPDLLFEAESRDPVAIFLVQTENRVLEALLLHSEAIQRNDTTRVVALLEREASIPRKTRIRATNRLEALTVFEGDEDGAVSRISSEVLGRSRTGTSLH